MGIDVTIKKNNKDFLINEIENELRIFWLILNRKLRKDMLTKLAKFFYLKAIKKAKINKF